MGVAKYVSQLRGSDLNGGTDWGDEYATIGKALDEIAALGTPGGNDSIIHVGTGTYTEGEFVQGAGSTILRRLVVVGHGDAKIDLTGFDYLMDLSYNSEWPVYFVNLEIFGWEQYLCVCSNTNVRHWMFFGCQVYQKGAKYQDATAGRLRSQYAQFVHFYNSAVFGLDTNTRDDYLRFYQSIAYGCIAGGSTPIRDWNAANIALWQGTHGWDTAALAPPFKDTTIANPDLDFDSGHVNFDAYMTAGERGGPVGAPSSLQVMWHPGYVPAYDSGASNKVFNLSNAGPFCSDAPENDTTYYDPSWQNVVISLGVNDAIDFEEALGVELNATLAAGTYTSGNDLATAVKTALEAAGGNTYTVAFGTDTLRLSVSSSGAHFSLLWSTGTNAGTTAGDDLGFDTSADDTGSLGYASDYGLTVGGGVAGCAPAIWNVTNEEWEIDLAVEPSGTSARVRTGVIEHEEAKQLLFLGVDRYKDGLGEVDSEQGTTTRKVEVRANATSFAIGDAAGTTTLDWTEYEYSPSPATVNQTYRFLQERFTLRINATV